LAPRRSHTPDGFTPFRPPRQFIHFSGARGAALPRTAMTSIFVPSPGTTTPPVVTDVIDPSKLTAARMDRAMRGVTPALSARRRPLHRRLVESEKPTASPQRSPETRTSVCQGCTDSCYCKMSLRFSSNSALSISPLANRSFKISRAREAVSYTSGSSSRRALRRP
jgi:hypothetical protein